MGLSQVPEEMTMFYGTLTAEEKSRMQPCTRAKCVMRPGDSPPPLTTSIPSGYDIPDDASRAPSMIAASAAAITTTSVKPLHPDGEAVNESDIEEAVPVVCKSLPTPEPQPKIEKNNGFDRKVIDEKKQLVHDPDDDPCIVKCVYFAQQCCECTIL